MLTYGYLIAALIAYLTTFHNLDILISFALTNLKRKHISPLFVLPVFQVPFDESRLVFPPVPAGIIAAVCYQPVCLLNSAWCECLYNSRLVLAGGLIGYLCYDMIHYYIHYGSPRNQYFYHLKRYHYNHHFVNHDKGFGISSPFWDEVFGTKIILKKLKYLLKW